MRTHWSNYPAAAAFFDKLLTSKGRLRAAALPTTRPSAPACRQSAARPFCACLMRTTTLVLSLVAVLAGTARAGATDNQWCRYTTEHAEFLTDLPTRRVVELAQRMEVFRQSVQPFVHGDHQVSEEARIEVVAFRSAKDFQEALQATHFTGFMRSSLRQSQLLVSPGPMNQWLTRNTLHEYTHYLLRKRLDVRIPSWYDEGLASLLSTARITRREVILGRAPMRALRRALQGNHMDLASVLDASVLFDLSLEQLNELYLTSWTLMHYILLGAHKTSELEVYLRSTHRGLPDALQMSLPELKAQLQAYLKRRSLPVVKRAKPAVEVAVKGPKCLSDLERDHALIMLAAHTDRDGALARLHEIIQRAPDFLPARLSLASTYTQTGEYDTALRYAQDALDMAPDSADAQIRLGLALSQTCLFKRSQGCAMRWQRATQLLEGGLRADPTRIDAKLGLGVAYLHDNRPQDATAHLRSAYEHAPWVPHINLYLGECYRLLGDPRARILLTNALNWTEAPVLKRLATAALRELNEAEERRRLAEDRLSETDGSLSETDE